ncbi:MAG: hypothetical protein GF331_24365 [Chitinivibrionales bacterium]|nr:hypothetical protein [Chitinivibrionales bacterium]
MLAKIGETAGRIWDLLSRQKKIAVEELPKALEDEAMLVYQSLGWLAREDKIEYIRKGDTFYVSLSTK